MSGLPRGCLQLLRLTTKPRKPAIPRPTRDSGGVRVLRGTIKPLPDVNLFFPCYPRCFSNELCFWKACWCIFLSIIYLKVRSKYVWYKFPMFAIQAIVPLHSKLCDTGGNANISHSAPVPYPQLPFRKRQHWQHKSPNLPRKKHLFGNSL